MTEEKNTMFFKARTNPIRCSDFKAGEDGKCIHLVCGSSLSKNRMSHLTCKLPKKSECYSYVDSFVDADDMEDRMARGMEKLQKLERKADGVWSYMNAGIKSATECLDSVIKEHGVDALVKRIKKLEDKLQNCDIDGLVEFYETLSKHFHPYDEDE